MAKFNKFPTQQGGGSGAGGSVTAGSLFNPDISTTFFEVGTDSINTFTAGELKPQTQRVPVIDSIYEHLNIPVKWDAGGAGFLMTRGKNADGGVIWSNDFGSPPTAKGALFAMAYWYDEVSNNLYWLSTSLGSPQTAKAIQKVDVATGAWTELMKFPLTISINAKTAGQIIEPLDPSDPDNSNWRVIYPELADPYTMLYQEFTSAGDSVGGIEPFKIDPGGANEQEVRGQGGYLTADKTILMTPPIINHFGPGSTSSFHGSITFDIARGSSRRFISLPIDENRPWSSFTTDTMGAPDYRQDALVVAWGANDVILMADRQDDAINSPVPSGGKRIFNRASFDSELQKLADYYGLGPAEAFL